MGLKKFKDVLLLNSSFEPIRILSWERAMVLWFCDKVDILEFHNLHIKTAKNLLQLPSVLKLKKYIYPKHLRKVRFCRENIYLRDEYSCQYCGVKLSFKELTLDHVIPLSNNGPRNWSNLVSCCRGCNQKKANKTLHEAGMKLRSEPKTPRWLPNFEMDPNQNEFPEIWLEYFESNKKSKAG